MQHGRVANGPINVKKYTVEPPIKGTPNIEHLPIKDKSTCPNSYYISSYIITSE